LRPAWAKVVRPCLQKQNKNTKWAGNVARVVEHLPGKDKSLVQPPKED
jgi:hypothetical protein